MEKEKAKKVTRLSQEILLGMSQAHGAEIAEELMGARNYDYQPKDILIVVHNELEYVQKCIERIACNTVDYHLYIWDNGSDQPTRNYLNAIGHSSWVTVVRNETNEGFIIPNNRLAAMGSNPYIILLNSDTEVTSNWADVMLSWLQHHDDTALVGCQGYRFNEEFKGGQVAFGYNSHYVSGWGLCMSRETYNQYGLFDEKNLTFAYAEDADLALRLQEAGHKVYGLHSQLVVHFENKTIRSVAQKQSLRESFDANHAYLAKRWADFPGLQP